jgi:hypothetical protein
MNDWTAEGWIEKIMETGKEDTEWLQKARIEISQVKEKGPILDKEQGHKESKKALRELLSKYVLVSADKCENNVIVVCRRYYVQRVREELEGKDKTEAEKT